MLRPLFSSIFPVAFAMIALLLTGCDNSSPSASKPASGASTQPASTASSDAASAEPVVVGQYVCLTGDAATFGQSTDHGVQLALREFNAAGGVHGRPVDLHTLDTASKSSEAGACVSRLINQDHAVALLGEVTSSRTLAGAPIAQQLGIPDLTYSATNVKVTQIGDMVFRVCYIDPYQGDVVAHFLHEDLKITKAAILFDQSEAYSTGLRDVFTDRWTKSGGTIVSTQSYSTGDADFNAQLTTIRDAKPQAIFIPGYYNSVAQIVHQARQLGIGSDTVLIGCDGWDSETLLANAADFEGTYFSNHYSPDETRPEVQAFVEKYKKEFKKEPDGLAALGYDGARILFDSLNRAKSLSGRDIADAIAQTADFPGVTGKITIDPNRNASKPAVIIKIKGGKFTFFASVAPPK